MNLDSFLEHSQVLTKKKRECYTGSSQNKKAFCFVRQYLKYIIGKYAAQVVCVTLTPPALASFSCTHPWSLWLHLHPVYASSLLDSQNQALGVLEESMIDKAGKTSLQNA